MYGIKECIFNQYGIKVEQVNPILSGVGGETYHIISKDQSYVFKNVRPDCMSHPELELTFFVI